MLYNPDGIFVMNQRRPSWEWLTEHAKQSNYSTIALMDANKEAGDLQRETGIPYVCHRTYTFEPSPPNSSISKIREYANDRFDDVRRLRDASQNGNVLHEINCERGFSDALMYMYAFMVERSVELNDIIGMVFFNGASGSVPIGFWGEPNHWENPGAQYYLKIMHRFRNKRLPNGAYAFIHGTHYYTSQYPLIAVNGGRWRKNGENWRRLGCENLWNLHINFEAEKALNWADPQDHLARDYQGQMRSLGWLPAGDHFIPSEKTPSEGGSFVYAPWTISTEHGFDNMNDVRRIHWDELRIMPKFDTPRGFRSLEETWAQDDWFPGTTPGNVLAWCNAWTYRNVFSKTGVHIGGHTYAVGDTSGPNFWWISFNLWDTGLGDAPAFDYFDACYLKAHQVEMPSHFFFSGTQHEPIPKEPKGCLPKPLRALISYRRF